MICTPLSACCSGSSFCPKYCLPRKIAILAFFSASLHWCLRSDIFPVLRFSLNTSEKVLLYVFLHHELSVLSVMPNQPQISSRVHCNPHRLSNWFWSMFFLGLPVRAILSPFHPLFFDFARAFRLFRPFFEDELHLSINLFFVFHKHADLKRFQNVLEIGCSCFRLRCDTVA